MEDKRTKQALKNLRDAFEADYAILILSKERFDKVFTSADDNKQRICRNVRNFKQLCEFNET